MTTSSSTGTALVTGASSGIGLTFAERLAKRGYNLILVARNGQKLEQLADKIRADTGVSVEVLATDLSTRDGMASVAERIRNAPDLTLLVNNAGLGDIARFTDVDWDNLEQMIAVNVTALTRLTHAAVPGMLARDGGTIINVSSGLAFTVMEHGFSTYGATKAYVAHFTEILHEELKDTNIRLQALIPGLTRTNLGGAEDSGFFDRFPPEIVMSTEDLVDASLAALELGELFCLPRLENYEDWIKANSAIRAIGQTPPSNKPVERYTRLFK